jgi:outer membrane protein assembly factor BamB
MLGTPRRALAVLVATVALVASACTADWTQRLGDNAHTARSNDTQLTAANVSTLTEKWRLQPGACNGVDVNTTGAVWFATPVTFKGVIYIGSDFGCLYAIRESNGQILWTRKDSFQPQLTCVQRLGVISSVNVQDDGTGQPVLYFHSGDGYLYKLKGSDGSVIWKSLVQVPKSTANDVFAWSSPTVANGKVIIGISSNCDIPFTQGQVRAYNATTGALIWTHKTIPDGFAGAGDWYDAAVDGNGDVYVSTGSTYDETAAAHPNTTDGFEQYSLLKLDGDTGALIWKAPAPEYLNDPDYATSPILFTGGGVALVGATNKDGWFRVYRQDNGTEVWQAYVGKDSTETDKALSGGGVFDGQRLFVVSTTTQTGGTWAEVFPRVWVPINGTPASGSIRELDPATGALVSRGGRPFEIPLPVDVMGPCAINANGILVCTGGQLENADIYNGHNNGAYIVDTKAAPARILRHLEDRDALNRTVNYGEFSEPIIEHGSIIVTNNFYLTKWGQ